MNFIKTTHDDVSAVVSEVLRSQTDACVYCVAEDYCAVVGSSRQVNVAQANNLGVKIVEIGHEGGTIIVGPGDIDIGIFTTGYSGDTYRVRIVDAIIAKIREQGHEALLDGNDICINGKKVAGFGSRMFGNVLYTAIHVSVGINQEYIRTICTKPMQKVPDGLKNYGLTTSDILEILANTFNHNFM